MTKEEIKKNLLGFQDLKKRWRYSQVQGARKRARFDRKFPKPIFIAGNGARVFWLPDIEEYEKLRGKIDVSQSRYTFYETKEEFESKTRAEREKQRGFPYSDEEWEEIKNRKN